jgi:hypothetical protein
MASLYNKYPAAQILLLAPLRSSLQVLQLSFTEGTAIAMPQLCKTLCEFKSSSHALSKANVISAMGPVSTRAHHSGQASACMLASPLSTVPHTLMTAIADSKLHTNTLACITPLLSVQTLHG